jgi:hypothetical protein
MPLITKFEDIQAWQEARTLSRQIYELYLRWRPSAMISVYATKFDGLQSLQ